MGCLSDEFFSATVFVDSLCDRSLQRLKTLFTLWQLQHHSLFIGSFSIYRGSGNTTQFSYNTFPYTVAAATPLNFHTTLFHIPWQRQHNSIFIQYLFSRYCGSGKTTQFSYTHFPYAVATTLTSHTFVFDICSGSGNNINCLYICFPYYMLWQRQKF